MDVSMCSLIPLAYVERGKITDAVEKFSLIKTLQAIEDANVVMLVIDAREGISNQDSRCWALFSIVGAHLSLW